MKESEYIDVTDLEKLRAAYVILGDTTGTGAYAARGNLRYLVFVGLMAWIEDVESRVRDREAECKHSKSESTACKSRRRVIARDIDKRRRDG